MVAKLLETPAEQAVEHARNHIADLPTDELLALAQAAMTEVTERTLARASDERDPRGEYEQLITGAQAVLNSAQALRSTAIARYASVDDHPDQPGELTQRPLGHQSEFADSDIAPMLRVSSRTASWITSDACTATVVAPRLLRLAGTGAVSMYLVDKITELLEHTTPDIRARVEQRLLDSRIETATTVQALRWVRRWLMTLDPDALSGKTEKGRKERVDVRWWGGDLPGLTEFIATLPAGHAAQIITAVDTLAKQLHADPANAGKTMGECRADALLQLVMANVTCHIQLTLLGHAPAPPPGGAHGDPPASQSQSSHHASDCAAADDESCCHTSDPPAGVTPSHHLAANYPALTDQHSAYPSDADGPNGSHCSSRGQADHRTTNPDDHAATAQQSAHADDAEDDFWPGPATPNDHDAAGVPFDDAADFAAYLDDWCRRASIPGSLEHAVAAMDMQESLDEEAANAHQYDAEAFEAWFAPIVDAAARLDDPPFDLMSGDEGCHGPAPQHPSERGHRPGGQGLTPPSRLHPR